MGSACSLGLSNTKNPVVKKIEVKREEVGSENPSGQGTTLNQNGLNPQQQQQTLNRSDQGQDPSNNQNKNQINHKFHKHRRLINIQELHPDLINEEDFEKNLRIGKYFLCEPDSILTQPKIDDSSWKAFLKAGQNSVKKQASESTSAAEPEAPRFLSDNIHVDRLIANNINNGRIKQLIGLIERGEVPQYDRWSAWKARLSMNAIFKPNLYEYLLREACPCKKTIEKDIARAFPDEKYFRFGNEIKNQANPQNNNFNSSPSPTQAKRFTFGEESLMRVLHAIAIYFPEFGYTQGMNMVVGFLLLVNGGIEEEAFWMFVLLATSPNYLIMGLYENLFPLIDVSKHIFDFKLAEALPEVHGHICGFLQIRYEEWFFQWVITLFLDKFPLEFVVRFWDFIIGQDTFFAVISLSIAILAQIQNQILKLEDQGDFHQLFNSFYEDSKAVFNVEKIIATAKKIKIPAKFISKTTKLYLMNQSSNNLLQSQRQKQSNRYTEFFISSDLISLKQEIIKSILTVPTDYHVILENRLTNEQKPSLSERDVVEKPQLDEDHALSSRSEGISRRQRFVDTIQKQAVIFMHPTKSFLPPIIVSKKEFIPKEKDNEPNKIDIPRFALTQQPTRKNSATSNKSSENVLTNQVQKKESENFSVKSNQQVKQNPQKAAMRVTNLDYLEKEARSETSSVKSMPRNYFLNSSFKENNIGKRGFLRSQSQMTSSLNMSSPCRPNKNHPFTPRSQKKQEQSNNVLSSSTHDVSGFSSVLTKGQHPLQLRNIKQNLQNLNQQDISLKHNHSSSEISGENSFSIQNGMSWNPNQHFSSKKQKNQLQSQNRQQIKSPPLGAFNPGMVIGEEQLSNNPDHRNQRTKHHLQQITNKSNSLDIQENQHQQKEISQFTQNNSSINKNQTLIELSNHQHKQLVDKPISEAVPIPILFERSTSNFDSNSPQNRRIDQQEQSSRINDPQHQIAEILAGTELNELEIGESTIRFDSTSRSKQQQVDIHKQIQSLGFSSPVQNNNVIKQQIQQEVIFSPDSNADSLQQQDIPKQNFQVIINQNNQLPISHSTSINIKGISNDVNNEIGDQSELKPSYQYHRNQSDSDSNNPFTSNLNQNPFKLNSEIAPAGINQLSLSDNPFKENSPSSSCLSPRIIIPASDMSYEDQPDYTQKIPRIHLQIKKAISHLVEPMITQDLHPQVTPPGKKIEIPQTTQSQHQQQHVIHHQQRSNIDDINMSGYINELPQHNISGFSQYHPQQASHLTKQTTQGTLQNSNMIAFSSFRRDSEQGQSDIEEQKDTISNIGKSTDRAQHNDHQISSSLSEFSYPHKQVHQKQALHHHAVEEESMYPEISPFEKQKFSSGNIQIGIDKQIMRKSTQKETAQKMYGQNHKYQKSNSLSINNTGNNLMNQHSMDIEAQQTQNQGVPISSLIAPGHIPATYDSKFNNNYFGSVSHLHEIQEEIHPENQNPAVISGTGPGVAFVGENKEILEQSISRLSSSVLSANTNQTHRSNRIAMNGSGGRQGIVQEDEDHITTSMQSASRSGRAYQSRRIIGTMAQKNLVSSQTDIATTHLPSIPPRSRQPSKHSQHLSNIKVNHNGSVNLSEQIPTDEGKRRKTESDDQKLKQK